MYPFEDSPLHITPRSSSPHPGLGVGSPIVSGPLGLSPEPYASPDLCPAAQPILGAVTPPAADPLAVDPLAVDPLAVIPASDPAAVLEPPAVDPPALKPPAVDPLASIPAIIPATAESLAPESLPPESLAPESLAPDPSASKHAAAPDHAPLDRAPSNQSALDRAASNQAAPDQAAPDQAASNPAALDHPVSNQAAPDPAALDHPVSNQAASDHPEESDPAASTDDAIGFWPVLQNRNFLTLWGGQVFSQLADKVYLVLMIGLVTQYFEGPGQTISGWVSAIMIAFTIPAVLFGSVAGVYVDRHPKRQVLVISNLFRGALVLALPLLLTFSIGGGHLGTLPFGFCLLLLVTFLVSTLTQFFAPAEQAAIPLLVEQRQLLPANSLYTTTMMAAMIVGFAIGEPALDWADRWLSGHLSLGNGREILVGGAYVIAGAILMLIRVRESQEKLAVADRHPWQDIKEGWAYLSTHPLIRAALVQLVILFSIVAALSVLAVRLAEVIPELDADQFGWLLSVGSLGMGLGAVVVGQFCARFPRHQVVRLGSLGLAASLGGLALLYHTLWTSLTCITVLGFFAALVGIPMQTTIQEETPPEMRGKVFGLQNNAVNIALSLPLALAGVAESYWGLTWTLGGLAALTLFGGLATAPRNGSAPD
ncbi:MAG: MFS transporter [Prochlorothrix sp.]